MPSPRINTIDAYFSDEWLPSPLRANPRGVHYSRFTTFLANPTGEPLSKMVGMKNPLDPSVGAGLPRPETQIPPSHSGALGQYCIFVPPTLFAAAQIGLHARPVKVTVVFVVGPEFNRHGLRNFFLTSTDRVLITVPGIEATAATSNRAWGIGIDIAMVNQLFAAAGCASITDWIVDTIAGYSTGHRGVNGTINNSLLPIGNLNRLMFYDALFWGDEPGAPGDVSLPTPPGVSPPAATSAQNTWRMLNAVRAARPLVDIVTYEVSEPGGTPRDGGRLRVDVPAVGVINLKLQRSALQALVLARVLGNGVSDGYFTMSSVPAPIATLIGGLPTRGTIASSFLAAARLGTGLTLESWAAANAPTIAAADPHGTTGLNLIRTHLLMGWLVPSLGDMLHDGFIQEFGWEFLAG